MLWFKKNFLITLRIGYEHNLEISKIYNMDAGGHEVHENDEVPEDEAELSETGERPASPPPPP